MDTRVREALCRITADYGADVGADPRRVDALLRDLCPGCRLETNVLVQAAREQVPTHLGATDAPLVTRVTRAVRALVDHAGLAEPVALWAVETWAAALGIRRQGDNGHLGALAAAGEPATRP